MNPCEHVLYVCTVFACVIVLACCADAGKTGVIAVARCRSRCLAKFVREGTSDSACEESKDCVACWDVCEIIFSEPDKLKDFCVKKKICGPGCKVACKFKRNPTKANVPDNIEFPEIPAVTINAETRTAYMAWTRPKIKDSATKDRIRLVYVLLSRDLAFKKRAWQQALQTADDRWILDLSSLPHNPEFWLLAVSERGPVAGVHFNTTIPDMMIYTGHEDIPDQINFPSKHLPVITFEESPLNLYMNMTSLGGRLYYELFWEHPANVSKPENKEYQIYIYLDGCKCDADKDYKSTIRIFNSTTKPHYKLTGIIYNAQYKVKVTLTSDERWEGTVHFNTPECNEMPPFNYMVCRHDTPVIPEVVRKTTTTTRQPTSTTSPVSPVSAIMYTPNDNILVPGWNITEVSKEYDKTSHRVFVTLKWTSLFNDSQMQILWTNIYHEKYLDSGIEPPTVVEGMSAMVELKLKPDTVYKVQVVAKYVTGSDTKRYTSEMREIDTNLTDNMPRVEAARRSVIDKEKEIFNGIILGVTILSSVIIFGIIIVFIYKKRQSFRDIIITKTAVAKSNSYKSNVGCKVDYSNQMLITSDDWEIDCRQLKLSGHIGQGAFGKVVTGYYNDERVAVKLVRDSAPISYKEDLLAEIGLMKRIGSHPNIVSMVGACTIMEPICLVMEYVPYGNLQNFLKKCRLEGELTINSVQRQELNYSLMDEHGGLNEGIVTPADLLSFARQVAMAMEYLGEKKYVHRDLAARNVLLGYDKIIKVCDFGLSRDIYNDNQYKKLTNGKLPLKWMAIESLRDRVFTTQSDVWSFGILLWEIVTMGASPYPNIALADLYYLLSNHYRMEKPSNCSDEVYIIMRQCWLDNPIDRPSFTDLRVQLELLLLRDRNYLELDNINVPLSTPETSSSTPVSDDTASLLAAQALQPQRKSSKDELTVDVCIHEKSVEKLLKRKGDFDQHNITIL